MCNHVRLQVAADVEPFVADVTLERFLARVNPEMTC